MTDTLQLIERILAGAAIAGSVLFALYLVAEIVLHVRDTRRRRRSERGLWS